jgi:hypothetical protein
MLLTDIEAGPVLGGVAPQTMRVWRVTGRGPDFVRVGRKVRYRMQDLEAFLEANRVRVQNKGKGKTKRTSRAA